MTERKGPDEQSGAQPEESRQGGADPETPPLHIMRSALEERLEWLREDRAAGYIEGSTEELRIVASASGSSGGEEGQLTESQKKAAARLKEREESERKQEKALEFIKKLGVTRVPGKHPGRRSTDR